MGNIFLMNLEISITYVGRYYLSCQVFCDYKGAYEEGAEF